MLAEELEQKARMKAVAAKAKAKAKGKGVARKRSPPPQPEHPMPKDLRSFMIPLATRSVFKKVGGFHSQCF